MDRSIDEDPKQLYLGLLKQTLAFNLWPEPPIPLIRFNYRRSFFSKALISFFSRITHFAISSWSNIISFHNNKEKKGEFGPVTPIQWLDSND